MKFLRSYKTFESFNSSEFDFSELNDDIKMDIIYNIHDNNEYLSDWNVWTLREYIENLIGLPKFEVVYRDVDDLYKKFEKMNWELSEVQLNKLMNLIDEGIELDPVITDNGEFFDGGHRLTAYKKSGKDKIPTIDISKFKNVNWKNWLEV